MNIQFEVSGFTFQADVKASPVIPAKTWGRPEDCYEAEGGDCEIDNLVLVKGDLLDLVTNGIDLNSLYDAAYKAALKQRAEDYTEYLISLQAA